MVYSAPPRQLEAPCDASQDVWDLLSHSETLLEECIAVTKAFEYKGDLAQTTLPEILFTIYHFRVAGVLEARRQGAIKRVFIRDGSVLAANSSDLQDSLGGYLRRTGRLTQEQFENTMRLRAQGKRRFGAVLVEQGLLGPEEVFRVLREQVEAIVWSLFYWQEGEVTFRIGDFDQPELVRIQLPIRQVILAGIKRAPDPKSLVVRLGKKETRFEPSYQVEELIESGLDGIDYTLLKLVDGQKTLFDVCTQGPLPPADNARLMYAFQVLQLIRKVHPTGEHAVVKPALRPEAAPAVEAQPLPRSQTGQIRIKLKTERDRGEV